MPSPSHAINSTSIKRLPAMYYVQARKEAAEWKPRLDSAQEELFKLEKALEIKVGS